MFKFGFHSKEQLSRAGLDSFRGKRRFIAADLYNNLDEDFLPEERDYILGRILSRLAVANKTFKYTHSKRFDDFDSQAVKLIMDYCDTASPMRLHDIGVSDGRTACDLFNKLFPLYGPNLNYFASDYSPYLKAIFKDKSCRVILDDRDNVIQIVFPPFVFNTIMPESILLYPLNHLTRQIVSKTKVAALLADYRAGSPAIKVEDILLLHPCMNRLIRNHNEMQFMQYDVLAGPKPAFEVVRAMNLLNLTYFSEEQLQLAIGNIFESLIEGGLFVTGSNLEQGSVIHGGIYRKQAGVFSLLYKSGDGSQVDKLISKLN